MSQARVSYKQRVEGGLLGLLTGDALGVPYEFHSPEEIPREITFTPPPGFDRAHDGVPPGTWSDDGAQALCLLSSLLECDGFDAKDFAHRIVRWHQQGFCAVDNIVFDVGVTTARAIQSLRLGTPPLEAGPAGVRDNGNGSLMRSLPLALWHVGTDAELVEDAHNQSRVTHGHLRAQVCCALYCLWARQFLTESSQPWEDAVRSLTVIYSNDLAASKELESMVRPTVPTLATGSGYVVDCLHSARFAMQEETYPAVVRSAIRLGDDTDTTACVAGGVAGIRGGVEAIPDTWISQLRGREIYQPLLESLLRHLGANAA